MSRKQGAGGELLNSSLPHHRLPADRQRSAPRPRVNHQFLVIGYGNDLRSDDGVGQRVADEVASWAIPNLRSLAVHQLTPELAELIASMQTVIFVDAYPVAQGGKIVQVCQLKVEADSLNLGHISNPPSLLALAQLLYNHAPPAWLVTVPAVNFELGENLSEIAQQGLAAALEQIRWLTQSAN